MPVGDLQVTVAPLNCVCKLTCCAIHVADNPFECCMRSCCTFSRLCTMSKQAVNVVLLVLAIPSVAAAAEASTTWIRDYTSSSKVTLLSRHHSEVGSPP